MPAWPASLPQQPLQSGYSEQPQSQALWTDMDAGPAKSRRRFTAAARDIPVTYRMSEAQTHIFEDWFERDLAGGVLPFDWVPARQRSAVSVNIYAPQGQKPYTMTPVSGSLWQVSFILRVNP